MSADLRAMLPCYLSGDLGGEECAQVKAALEADPSLAQALEALQAGRTAAQAALFAQAPVVSSPASQAQEPAAPVRVTSADGWGLGVGLAAAAVLLFGLRVAVHTTPEQIELLKVQTMAEEQPAGFIHARTPAELVAAFRAAGVAPSLAMAPDLQHLGFSMVGGLVDPAGRHGSVVVYEKDGRTYACQMYAALGTSGGADATHHLAGLTLQAFEGDGEAIVSWRAPNGMVCLFSGAGSAEDLLAMVEARFLPS